MFDTYVAAEPEHQSFMGAVVPTAGLQCGQGDGQHMFGNNETPGCGAKSEAADGASRSWIHSRADGEM